MRLNSSLTCPATCPATCSLTGAVTSPVAVGRGWDFFSESWAAEGRGNSVVKTPAVSENRACGGFFEDEGDATAPGFDQVDAAEQVGDEGIAAAGAVLVEYGGHGIQAFAQLGEAFLLNGALRLNLGAARRSAPTV